MAEDTVYMLTCAEKEKKEGHEHAYFDTSKMINYFLIKLGGNCKLASSAI